MKQDLTEFETLKEILGYTDERSVVKWCKSNKIPVLKMGFKKYILSHYLTEHIDNQLVIFEKANPKLKITHRQPQRKYKPNSALIEKYLAEYESEITTKAA